MSVHTNDTKRMLLNEDRIIYFSKNESVSKQYTSITKRTFSLDRHVVAQLLKKLHALHGTRKFIIVFIIGLH